MRATRSGARSTSRSHAGGRSHAGARSHAGGRARVRYFDQIAPEPARRWRLADISNASTLQVIRPARLTLVVGRYFEQTPHPRHEPRDSSDISDRCGAGGHARRGTIAAPRSPLPRDPPFYCSPRSRVPTWLASREPWRPSASSVRVIGPRHRSAHRSGVRRRHPTGPGGGVREQLRPAGTVAPHRLRARHLCHRLACRWGSHAGRRASRRPPPPVPTRRHPWSCGRGWATGGRRRS